MDIRRLKLFTLFTVCVFLYLVGLVLRLQQVFFMCLMAGLLPLWAWLLTRLSLSQVQVERRLPDRLFEDEEAVVQLRIRNRGWWPRLMLRVEDPLPPWVEAASDSQNHTLFPTLWPGETRTFEYSVVPVLRGWRRWERVEISSTDPMDLYTARGTLSAPAEMLVYPRPLEGMATQILIGSDQSSGVERSRRVTSDGIEFHSTREYNPGDDLRRIHWKTTARTGRLSVIEFEVGYLPQRWLVLDLQAGTHSGAGRESSLEYAVKQAVSLARHHLDQGSAVGLWAQGAREWRVELGSSPDQWMQMLEVLAQVEDDGEEALAPALRERWIEFAPAGSLALFTAHPDPSLLDVVQSLIGEQVGVECYYFPAETFRGEPLSQASLEFVGGLQALQVPTYTVAQGQERRLRWEQRHVLSPTA